MSNDPTEPRWTCSNGHSCPANSSTCTMPGCGAAS
jgi:hypothetical protein